MPNVVNIYSVKEAIWEPNLTLHGLWVKHEKPSTRSSTKIITVG